MITILVAYDTLIETSQKAKSGKLGDLLPSDALEWLRENVGEFDRHTASMPYGDPCPSVLTGHWDVVWADREYIPKDSSMTNWLLVRLGTDDEKLAVYFKLRWC